VTLGYDAQTAVERELVLRLASLLWRLRRANTVETYLLQIQAEALGNLDVGRTPARPLPSQDCSRYSVAWPVSHCLVTHPGDRETCCAHDGNQDERGEPVSSNNFADRARRMAHSFLRLASHDSQIFERLSRYEAALWRQTVQTLIVLQSIKLR